MNSTNNGTGASSEGGNILSGQNPIKFSLADPLPLFIVQTVIILSLCHIINLGMQRLRQPKVVSEVLSGIILGPSILGQIPGFTNLIFPTESIPFLTLVANLGLVLFLFLVGLELDPKLIMKRAKHALGISIAGLVIPFSFSCGVSILLYKDFEKPTTTMPSPPFSEFLLTCGVAMSLTAFPVLARILAEMQLMSTTVGFITVCAAAAGDIVAWLLLALLVSLINATTPIMPLYVVLMGIAWGVFLVYAVRPLLLYLVRLTHSEEEPSQKMIAVTLVVVLTSAFVTNIIGIHAIFGGFLVGLLIPHDSGFAEGLTRRIEDLVGVYFLPIFFACSGFKTQVSLLNNGETWGLVVMVTSISCFGKMLGCTTAAKYNGMTWRESFAIGFLMNCKGLVEYIILNIGHDAGVISDRVFVILIAMCLILTMIATPFVGYLYPVWYQKELEVKREAERKALALRPKGAEPDKKTSSQGGFFSGITCKLRRRKGADGSSEAELGVSSTHGGPQSGDRLEDLDSVRIYPSDREGGLPEDEQAQVTKKTVVKNSIMFCLDKTSNAPGVMTLLQLFAGSATASLTQRRSNLKRAKGSDLGNEKDGKDERYKGILQPSIDISNPQGESFVKNKRSNQDIKIQPKIYAIRLLHISERTSAAMLTASRCMDRLYKDTVMMMVMAFAKLNSVPLKPLVAISTDSAQSTVAQDILDRAMDLDVGWVVFPWNSSHLTDLPMPSTPAHSGPGGPLFATGSNVPGLAISMADTNTSVQSNAGPVTPAVNTATQDGPNLSGDADLPRVFPYNISRYFDHEEAQKIASGGHVNLSQTSESHRTSIASNTKVLSKLIAATGNASRNVSTAVLVDRGLGLVGGVEHIVVPLLGGSDDYDTLCLASCLSRNTKCFVTVLRIASRQQQSPHHQHGGESQQTYQFQSHLLQPANVPLSHHVRQPSHDKSVPPSPDVIKSKFIGGASSRIAMSGHQHSASEERAEDLAHVRPRAAVNQVPKDDKELLKTFFASKPQFQGHHRGYRKPTSRSAQASNGRGVSGGEQGEAGDIDSDSDLDDDDDATQVEEGAMVLAFQEITDAILWARSYLTAQDLIVIGHDTPPELAPLLQHHHHQGHTHHHHHQAFSRAPSMDEGRAASLMDGGATSTRQTLSHTQVSHASPPSILERRGLTLSPRSDKVQPNADITNDSPLPRSSYEHERPARSEVIVQHKGRSRHRSQSRGRSPRTRSTRSLSRGRKQPDTPTGSGPSGSIGSGDYLLAGVSLTTCQLILGLVADQLIQSGVFCSLLVVRSRWISSSPNLSTSALRNKSSSNQMGDVYSPDSGTPLTEAPTRTSGMSSTVHAVPLVASGGVENERTAEKQRQHSVDDQTRQYRTQQRAHHSRLSQDLDSRALASALASPKASRPPRQDMGFVEEPEPHVASGRHGYSASDMETPRASGENHV
ncbi:MAG: Sodium/hydrogen exchanger family-domain-containing protein [Podila humilis]|nr:MAG: Sodium/hydrogen exchanger family-domain-containing protein [Podila humilis]